MLGVRNKEAMGISNSFVGSIWNSNKIGDIYQDGFFYTAKNFGWLKSVKEAEKVNSLVTGIGMKVVENTGGAVGFKTKPSQWKDATACENWTEEGGKKKCKANKKITVERVAYHESNGKKYELGKDICMLKVKENKNGKGDDIYLLVGLAEVNKKGTRGKGHEWEWTGESWLKNLKGCDLLKKDGWKKLKLKVEKHGISGDKNVASKNWIMVLGHEQSGIAELNDKKDGKSVVGVVLGLVGNWAVDGNAWSKFAHLESRWEKSKFVDASDGKGLVGEDLRGDFEDKQGTIKKGWAVNDNWDSLNKDGILDLEKLRKGTNLITKMGDWKGDMEIKYEWGLKE